MSKDSNFTAAVLWNKNNEYPFQAWRPSRKHSNFCRTSVAPVKDEKSIQEDPILAGEYKKEM